VFWELGLMFDSLSSRLSGIFDKLTGRGALSEADVGEAMREVRRALLEADVALDVVKSFIEKVTARAIGQEVVRSIKPGQMVIKIVNDCLIEMLGSTADPIDLNAVAPVGILMVGLQGSGKTTSTGKIAKRLSDKFKKKVLLASLDTRRPAAMEQLAILGKKVGVDTLPIIVGQSAVEIAKRAHEAARLGGYDVLMLDTAGRTTVDEELMAEVAEVKRTTNPHEVLLVADALTGQDAVNTARAFDAQIGITGIVLTRIDGDGRGGAALSMRAVTGKPIKLIGVGEKEDALEDFQPERIANLILGMGDIVSLVERATQNINHEDAMRVAQKMAKGKFDLDDLAMQLKQLEKMGGLQAMMGMIPGAAKLKGQIPDSAMNDKAVKRQLAIISSMTKKERENPDLLKNSRKKRIAAGSGTSQEEINKLIKMYRQMADMMKMMSKGKGGMMAKMAGMMGLGGGGGGLGGMMNGGMPDAAQLEDIQRQIGGNMPKLPENFPGGSNLGGFKLPGLGSPKLPNLGGFPFGGGKKK
jgi:signal recognition particle subunit SRP54